MRSPVADDQLQLHTPDGSDNRSNNNIQTNTGCHTNRGSSRTPLLLPRSTGNLSRRQRAGSDRSSVPARAKSRSVAQMAAWATMRLSVGAGVGRDFPLSQVFFRSESHGADRALDVGPTRSAFRRDDSAGTRLAWPGARRLACGRSPSTRRAPAPTSRRAARRRPLGPSRAEALCGDPP